MLHLLRHVYQIQVLLLQLREYHVEVIRILVIQIFEEIVLRQVNQVLAHEHFELGLPVLVSHGLALQLLDLLPLLARLVGRQVAVRGLLGGVALASSDGRAAEFGSFGEEFVVNVTEDDVVVSAVFLVEVDPVLLDAVSLELFVFVLLKDPGRVGKLDEEVFVCFEACEHVFVLLYF